MIIKNRTDQIGASSEPGRRKSNFPRAMLASLCLVVIATGIGVLFITRSAPSPVAQKEAASSPTATSSPAASSVEPGSAGAPAVAGPCNTQEVKTTGPAVAVRRVAGKGAEDSNAQSRAHGELAGSRGQRGSAITATELRQPARKGIAQLFRALHQSPASTPVATQGVFRTAPLRPVAPETNPVFSILRNPDAINKQVSPESAAAAPQSSAASLDAQPLQRSSGEQVSRDLPVGAAELRVDSEDLPRVKSQAPMAMLTSATGASGTPGTITGKLSAQAQAETQPQAKVSGLPQGIDGMSYDLPRVIPAVFRGDVRNLPKVPQNVRERPEVEEPFNAKQSLPEAQGPHKQEPNVPLAPMPSPIQNFAGLSRTDTCTGGQCGAGIPPDTNGDVGPSHYIQTVNTAVGIYNKTGTLLASFTFNSLFSGAPTGTPCDANNFGDPVVLYDPMADRWIVTDFAFAVNGSGNPIAPYYECIAASRSGDPVAGGWNLYAIRTDTGATGQPPAGTLNDYPKFGIWTDCLYYSANGFLNGASFNGVEFGSFSKTDMYSGAALTGALGFIAGTGNFTLLPANLSAPASGLPPPGTPEYFVSESATAFSWDVRKFTPGAHCGGGGSMSAATNVTQPVYTVPAQNIVPQPNDAGSLHNLDSLGDRLMQKAQYRKVGAAESLWVVHTTRSSASSNTQPGWAQLDITGGVIAAAPVQQQNYAPDTTLYRWMASIGADKDGNVAVGYSTSNGTSPNFPSIAYSGRLAGDALNMLPQTETQLIAAAGSELNNCGGAPCHRWGDYSSMSIDPTDSCTFWITNEYYVDQTGGNAGSWNTRIGSFSFTQPTQCSPAASSPTVPAGPTSLSITNVTATSMTLNWTDNAGNEDGYVIYRSTDNLNFTFAAETAANATSGNAGGLNPSTTYFFRVHAFTKGALSTALTGSQATTPPGVATSTAAGGLWSQTTTWLSGIVPTNNDNVTIVDGATVTIDTAAVALNVTVGTGGSAALLQWEATTARALTVGQGVTIGSNGTFQSATSGTQIGHVLTVGTNLTNNGVLNFSTNGNTAGAGLTFTGAGNNTFGGAGATTNLRTLTINKGSGTTADSSTPSLDITLNIAPTFGVQNSTTTGVNQTTFNGILKVSGSNGWSNQLFGTAAYAIPATGGLWLNNADFSVTGQNGSPTLNGFLRISQGTFNVGTSSGNSMGFGSGSTILVEGGAVSATGRFGVATSSNGIAYTQTGGTVTACTIGTSSTTLACFDLGTSLGSNIIISGGTIVIQIPNSAASGPRDYRNQAGGGIAGVSGGTVKLGNFSSGAPKAFNVAGVFPNLDVGVNGSAHSATMLAPAVYNNISLNITINTGNTLNIGSNVFLMNGATLTNNGTLTGNGAGSRFIWFATNLAQTYTGSGTVTAPMTSFEVQDDLGVTISPASPNIVTSRVILFTGGVTNANKITLGNGGATTGVVQIGNTTTPLAAGTFDVPMTFNLGTGGETVSYLRTTTSRTTGGEINPARTLTSMTYDDNNVTHTLSIAGGDLTLSSAGTALTLTNGRIITGSSTLALSSGTATVTRTNGYVDGNFRKNYSAVASKSFEVGTANGFSPVSVNVTAGSFPANFTVKAVQGPQPNLGSPQLALQRYWTLTATGVTADLTFNYLDPTDIPVTATEANFVIFKYDGAFTMPGGSVNTAANTASISGVTSFSDWTLGEPGAPTDVALNWFTADGYPATPNSPTGSVLVRWQTGYEVANLGFNIYREEDGKRVRLTPDLVAGSAFFVGARTVLGAGRSYVWHDMRVGRADSVYLLESIDLNGFSTWHGPVRATIQDVKQSSSAQVEPESKLIGQLTGGADGATSSLEPRAAQIPMTIAGLASQAIIAGQPAVKISVQREGWYRVSQSELAAAGLDSRVDSRMLQLLVDGQEQPINVVTEKDGKLSAIEFYGIGLDSAYTNLRTYWLRAGDQPGKRIGQNNAAGPDATGGSFPYAVERRDRTIYFAALRNGDKENFFGSVIAGDPVDQTLSLSRVETESSYGATLEVALQGVSTATHNVMVELNGSYAGTISFNSQTEGVGRFNLIAPQLREGQNVLRLTSRGGPSDISLVDYIRLTYPHRYTADGDALRFTVAGKQMVTADGFSSPAIRVLDITNPAAVQEMIGTVQQQKSGGYAVSLNPQGAEPRTLLAIAGDMSKPVSLAPNIPSSWRQPGNGANLAILTRREFFASLGPLVSARQKQGYSVAVVDIEDVYDEFSYGQKTPQAVKDFLGYAASTWKKAPGFVMLAGDASVDPKNYLGLGDSDLVPTKLIDTQYMETASDDWLVDFNGDGLPDMAIGRLPVRSAAEALRLATKIAGYDGQPSAGTMLLVSDLNDGFDFESASNMLRGSVPPNIRIETVERSHLDDATAKARLIDAINRGQIIVNYAGHGSLDQWRGNILTSADAAGLTNGGELSLFVMMTCLNGYFQDASLDSLAESLLKANGGAVAVWGSSGLTTPDIQAILNQQVFGLIFNGTPITIGEATARAKAAVTNGDVRRTWILLGDPTTRLVR